MKINMRYRDFVLFETVCFVLLITGITAATTDGPSNTVAEIGQQVNLSCTAENGIKWVLSKDGSSNGQLTIVVEGCMVNTGFEDHYKTQSLNAGKSCNLIVFDITMEQAGVYRCMPTGESYFASILTVIDSPPAVAVNTTAAVVQNETVLIECSLVHNGSIEPGPTLRPYFYWTDQNGQPPNVSSRYDSTTDNTAISRITVTAGRKNISSHTCHVYLQLIPSTDPDYASNIPSANSSAISPIIEVLYSPNIIKVFSSEHFNITIGGATCQVGALTCEADGNPPPSYEWFDAKENVSLSNDATLDVVEYQRSHRCVAYNTIRNEMHSDVDGGVLIAAGPITYYCRFPRNESTWIDVTFIKGSTNEACACSDKYDRLVLTCNADTYPTTALYKWIGPDNSVFNSQVLSNVTSNGVYHCMAYFDQSTSNYTGDDMFPNGTSVKNVTECRITAATTDGPSNTLAEIGQQVNLSCTAENGIKWVLSKDGSSNGQLSIVIEGCMVNTGFEDHYKTQSLNSGKSCNLIVFDITMEQAGVYKCIPAGGSYFASILTVIDSPPAVTVNTTAAVVQDETVLIECSLVHNGSIEPGPTLRPYFYWTDQNGQPPNVSSRYDSTTDNTAISQITIRAGRQNITSYTCHVYLQLIPSTDPSYASNIHCVNSSASSPSAEVLYGPDVSGFSNIYSEITIGGTTCGVVTITCIADGNPSPDTYEWFDNSISISNDVTLYQVEEGRQYKCVAKNTIRNEVYSDSRSVTHDNDPQDCKFPRNETTWIDVTLIGGCDDGTCACYDEFNSLTLTCNADTYPNASYKWIGPDNSVFNSQVLTNVTSNGVYHCIAYFDQTTSDYTGNGTSDIDVTDCRPIKKQENGPPPEMMDLLNGI